MLHGEESFGSVVGFQIVHPSGVGDLFILAAVGSEGDASVEEYFEAGPYVDKRREFGCPVGHEGSGARRHPDAVDERVDSLN